MGEHFPEALADASSRCGLKVSRVRQRELLERASEAAPAPGRGAAGSPPGDGPFGRTPWGADEISAALLAWLLLGGRAPESPRAFSGGADGTAEDRGETSRMRDVDEREIGPRQRLRQPHSLWR